MIATMTCVGKLILLELQKEKKVHYFVPLSKYLALISFQLHRLVVLSFVVVVVVRYR